MTILVLGEMSEKMVEADGFGAKVNFGLAKIRDDLKLVINSNNFTRRTDNADPRGVSDKQRTVFVDRGRQAPTANWKRVADPLATAGAAGAEVTMYGM